jgi:outer membrane protein OmpA-like peptidoglycan-associated protein
VLTEAGALIATLVARGSTPLDDLIFPAGTADLAAGDYASLEELGGWLLENPSVTVALVGHTDATGALSGNIVLSKRRAESVRRWLNAKFNLPAAQVVGEGMGYLAPRATNATPEGQAQNRRVEVIVTSTR